MIQYRHLFKRIDSNQDPEKLLKDRVYCGKVMFNPKNKNAFDKYDNVVYIKLLGYLPTDNKTENKIFFSIKIYKNNIKKKYFQE